MSDQERVDLFFSGSEEIIKEKIIKKELDLYIQAAALSGCEIKTLAEEGETFRIALPLQSRGYTDKMSSSRWRILEIKLKRGEIRIGIKKNTVQPNHDPFRAALAELRALDTPKKPEN